MHNSYESLWSLHKAISGETVPRKVYGDSIEQSNETEGKSSQAASGSRWSHWAFGSHLTPTKV